MHFHQLVALYSLPIQSAVEFDLAGNMRKQEAICVCVCVCACVRVFVCVYVWKSERERRQESRREWLVSGANWTS
jgi:hypothetical protein